MGARKAVTGKMPNLITKAEADASRELRTVLEPLPVGSPIGDSEEFGGFLLSLERLVPQALEQAHPYWQGEDLDEIRVSWARKTGPAEAEIAGVCLLMSDWTWEPIYLRLGVSAEGDEMTWLDCRLGKRGCDKGGMQRDSSFGGVPTAAVEAELERPDSIDWAYRVTLGKAPPPQLHEPPDYLNGARVLFWTALDPSDVRTGKIGRGWDSHFRERFAGLAIAAYEDSAGHPSSAACLYYCGEAWALLKDTYHDSVDAAKLQAEFECQGTVIRWASK